MASSDELTLVLTNTFENIPRILFEDSADEFLDEKAIDRLYKCDKLINSSPYSQVYEMRNEIGEVCGVLWLTVDPILNGLYGRFVSVFPKYRDGNVLPKITEFMENIATHVGLERIFGATQRNTEYWQSLGWEVADTRTVKKEVE